MTEYTDTYDALAARWDSWAGEIMPDVRAAWARQIEIPIHEGERVVELGCGTGVPVGQWLAHRYDYTGVDTSEGMLRVARRHVSDGTFVLAGMETVAFDMGSLGAVIAFYSIDHVPRALHADLFGKVASWLRPGGMLVASLHSGPEEDFVDPNWLDTGPMHWSGFDGATNLELLAAAGLDVTESEVIDQVEPDGAVVKPLWVVARKPH